MSSGGEVAKLSAKYEDLWTSLQLLELLDNAIVALVPEPPNNGKGIEFCKHYSDGKTDRHSVKSQTSESNWSLATLCREESNGRSFLGDLINQTLENEGAHATFVSQISAVDLGRICGEAGSATDFATFETRMQAIKASVRTDFSDRVVPLCETRQKAYELFRRIHVVTLTQDELIKTLDREILHTLYKLDGEPIDPAAVKEILSATILASFGQAITRDSLLSRFTAAGIGQTDWARDTHIRDLVARRNRIYLENVQKQWINNHAIDRSEAEEAFERLTNSSDKFGLFVGVAGLGKTCAVAQLVGKLQGADIPHLVLRLDLQTDEITSKGFGQQMDMPTSPVDVLYGMAGGRFCVLLIDQLDALSAVSGRNPNLWHVFEELLDDVRQAPNMKVWLVCRGFDLQNDPRLRQLVHLQKPYPIELKLLAVDVVKTQIALAHGDPAQLGEKQLEMLQVPMHLAIYLEGAPTGKPPFTSIQELYSTYWDQKQLVIRERLGRAPKWREVIEFISSELSKKQTLSMPADVLEDQFPEDTQQMASAHVLIKETDTYRFFHEGFFDYAFARIFVAKGNSLLALLLEGGEQDLFRRAQVRQVLAYLRSRESEYSSYLKQLKELLEHPDVRVHIKRLILDWMRTVPDPKPEEAEILGLHDI